MERRGEKFRRLRQHWKPEKYYPPGYEYRREWNVAAVLLGAGIVYSFRFLAGIQKAAEALYELRYGVKVYLRGVRAVSFAQLMQGYWFSFGPHQAAGRESGKGHPPGRSPKRRGKYPPGIGGGKTCSKG